MKKTDIAMIILITSFGVMIAYFIAVNIPFLKVPEDGVKVKTVQAISADIAQPNEQVFTKDAINPTVEVTIGSEKKQEAAEIDESRAENDNQEQTEPAENTQN